MTTEECTTPNATCVDRLARIETGVGGIQTDLTEMKEAFVTRAEFRPVRLIAYGLVSLMAGTFFIFFVAQAVAQ